MVDKKFIEYEGEDYRDDRMYVLNIGTGRKDGKKCWVLGTYRNTISLPPTRNDFFDTYKDLIDYIKKVEPHVPLISNNGNPIEIPDHVDEEDIEDVWSYFNGWLKHKKLFSSVNRISHVPYYLDKRGHKEVIFHATYKVIKQ
jgi:hypothetical protein